ncbi:unnamed protein product [Onchocerca flexuosa]|uniref:ORF2 n=1 Tax=Onchocerca flexuosa TaxID=387005 RepID=A0A183HCV5_9BILA|nr:unnamed protein product [Onchocerca flexuosa]
MDSTAASKDNGHGIKKRLDWLKCIGGGGDRNAWGQGGGSQSSSPWRYELYRNLYRIIGNDQSLRELGCGRLLEHLSTS